MKNKTINIIHETNQFDSIKLEIIFLMKHLTLITLIKFL